MVCTAAFHNGQYRKVSYIICTFVGNKIVDHSDVVGDLTVHVLPLFPSQWNLRLTVSYNTYRWLSARLDATPVREQWSYCSLALSHRYSMTFTSTGLRKDYEPTKDTPYLALTGELYLWVHVFCEYFWRKMTML